MSSEWTFAPNSSKSRFWITIARPNVVSSGTRIPERRLRSSSVLWSAQPTTAIAGRTTANAANADRPWCVMTRIRKAPRIARSPCARLMIRITPNMSDSPEARSA